MNNPSYASNWTPPNICGFEETQLSDFPVIDRYEYALKNLPESGGSGCHVALLGVATLGFWAGLDREKITTDLTARVAGMRRRKVTQREIRCAIDEAFSGRRKERVTQRAPIDAAEGEKIRNEIIARGIEFDAATLFDASPIRIDWTVERLYSPKEYLFIGRNNESTQRQFGRLCRARRHRSPRHFKRRFIPEHIIPNPLTGKQGPKKDGKLSYRADACVESFRFAVLDSLAGVAKTWLSLAFCQALTKGEPFLGVFRVPKVTPCIYLCPEMGAKAFRKRCEKLKLGGELFRVQTIADGVPIKLSSEILEHAIKELRPLVVLDTAIRFNPAKDENASAENNRGLAHNIFQLLSMGAIGVLADHHAPKASKDNDMTLENVLRGTGDIGAIADSVWGIQHVPKDDNAMRLGRCIVKCVKGRDFWPENDSFKIQLRPSIDQYGKIAMLEQEIVVPLEARINQALTANPRVSKSELAKNLGVTRRTLDSKAFEYGWLWVAKEKKSSVGTWTKL